MRTHFNFSHSRSRISFLQLKLAIRRFHLGPDSGINIESLSFAQVRPYIHSFADKKSQQLLYPIIETLFSIQAHIYLEPLGVYDDIDC